MLIVVKYHNLLVKKLLKKWLKNHQSIKSTTRIKNAIANGSYPIDLNKIADALFDAYKEMKD